MLSLWLCQKCFPVSTYYIYIRSPVMSKRGLPLKLRTRLLYWFLLWVSSLWYISLYIEKLDSHAFGPNHLISWSLLHPCSLSNRYLLQFFFPISIYALLFMWVTKTNLRRDPDSFSLLTLHLEFNTKSCYFLLKIIF